MDIERKKPWITTAIVLETRVTKQNNTHPVKLRITFERKQKYYVIKGESYTKEQFATIVNPESRGKNKVKRLKFYSIEERAIEVIDNELADFSFNGFEEIYKRKKRSNVQIEDLFKEKATELRKKNKFQSAILYDATLNSLKQFEENLSFEKITAKFLNDYESWMVEVETETKKKKSYTTVGMYMRNLRHIINKAIKTGLFNEFDYPFGKTEDGKYQIPSSKSFKRALTIGEIKQLFDYTTDNHNELHAKAYFLFSYLCNGMNMADIANLKYKNIVGDNLAFIRQKTKDLTKEKTDISVYLLPEIRNIINEIGNVETQKDNYIFPIYSAKMTNDDKFRKLKQHIKTTNKYLKRIGGKLGFEGVTTTQWARHSHATILKRSGVSYEFIGENLGHSSTKVTKNYLATFGDEQKKQVAKKLVDFE